MSSMEYLHRQKETGEELGDIVHVMKSLSATSIRQFEKAARNISQYQETVLLGLQGVLQNANCEKTTAVSPEASAAWVVIGSDRGLCGKFNERVVEVAQERVSQTQQHHALVVGSRLASCLENRGYPALQVISAASTGQAIAQTVASVLRWIDQHQVENSECTVTIIHHAKAANNLSEVQIVPILPITQNWVSELKDSPWPSRSRPIFTLPAGQLYSYLIKEHVFVMLFKAIAESLACEHQARLVAMQRAERHIKDYLAGVCMEINQQRQSSITQELFDIVASYDLLHNRDKRDS